VGRLTCLGGEEWGLHIRRHTTLEYRETTNTSNTFSCQGNAFCFDTYCVECVPSVPSLECLLFPTLRRMSRESSAAFAQARAQLY
jgi:hypothetical protein